jgi:alcohol dehydrogenase class IV
MQKAIGLPQTLTSAGVKREHLAPLADGAIEDACHRCNPRPCTRSDLLALYEASM